MTKKVLFVPLNSPGHINSSLGIADKLKNDFNFKTIFVIMGATIGEDIERHGHELIMLEERRVHEDYEISDDEDTLRPLDEERKIKLGRKKRSFSGCLKWPQILIRNQHLVRLPPVEAFIKCCEQFELTMVAEMLDNHDALEKQINEIEPDLIVIDAYYVPPCIVNWTKSPWVRLFSANPLGIYKSKLPGEVKPPNQVGFKLYTKEERLKLQNNRPEEWNKVLDEWRMASEKIKASLGNLGGSLNEFLTKKGCKPLEPGQQAHDSPHLNLYMFPRDLDYHQDDDLFEMQPRWFRFDSLMRKQTLNLDEPKFNYWNEKIKSASKGKEAIIYFSLGSIASGDFRLLKEYVRIFAKDQKRLYIISKGVNGDKFDLNERNMIGGNFIPQTFLLQHAQLAIIHGGNNSVTESSYYGLPMVIMPVFADQYDNAQRVEDLKLGKRLDPYELDEEKLMQAIDSILNDQRMIERCNEIGKQMRARDDAKKATLLLKKLIDDGQLEQSFIDDCRDKDADEINW